MCLAVPAKIVAVKDSLATVELRGVTREASLMLLPEAKVGDYVLVHAGLKNFTPSRPLEDYALHELIFDLPDFGRVYYPDKYLVTGHRPTFAIDGNPSPGKIYRANNHIAIDCGCGFGGALGCIRLDDGREYYV